VGAGDRGGVNTFGTEPVKTGPDPSSKRQVSFSLLPPDANIPVPKKLYGLSKRRKVCYNILIAVYLL
jgi:hypothetical protein